MMLENLRFDPGEEDCTPSFATNLSELGDVYVDDAFGAAHRAHASIVGPPAVMPSAAGRLLAAEVDALSRLMGEPDRPFVAVLGGAKVSDKLGVIDALLEQCDTLLIGGAMAFTFLAAQGYAVGDSLVEERPSRRTASSCSTPGASACPTDVVVAQEMTADAEVRHVSRDFDAGRLEGARHRSRDRRHVRRRARAARDRVVERADGRVRARPVRRGHAQRRRGGRRVPRATPSSAAATARPRCGRWVSPTTSTTCRPAAARRWS